MIQSSFPIAFLHEWFSENRRQFPWREDRRPYRVWISEVMLQQTRASVVVSYFLRWMELFPDIEALAVAPLERVIKAWEGLGFYSRARNLHAAAKMIVERFGGEIPNDPEALSSLPGLGPYTIGAILSFGFSQRQAAVDGNVARVISRYFAIEENIDRPFVRKSIEEKTLGILDEKEPWVSSEALIELGALVCSPTPDCAACPLQESCLGRQKGIAESLPIKNAKPSTIVLSRAVIVLEAEGMFLVRKEVSGKVMADLYEFPYLEIASDPTLKALQSHISDAFGIRAKCVAALPKKAHTFTKYKAWLYPFRFEAPVMTPIPDWEWVSLGNLQEIPFSAGHRAIARAIATKEV